MADVRKRPERAERTSNSDANAAGDEVAQRRDWARLGRRLPPMLASWIAIVAGGYFLAMEVPAPGLPGPLATLATPLEANPFRACRSSVPGFTGAPQPVAPELLPEGIEPALPNAPNVPNLPAEPPVQQQQQPIDEKIPEPSKRSSLLIRSAEAQEAVPEQSAPPATTSNDTFDSFRELPPAVGCDELGYGDLVDVVMDRTGERAWVINRYGLVYRSTDGGRTWAPQELPDFPTGASLSAIAADDAGKSLAIAVRMPQETLRGQFRFYRSDDGGDGWRLDEALTLEAAQFTRTNLDGFEILSLAVGADGDHLVASVVIPTGAVDSMTWTAASNRWNRGAAAIEVEMIRNIRMHDFGARQADLSASGGTEPPIAIWARWGNAGGALSFSRYVLDEQGSLNEDPATAISFELDAGPFSALAASDDGDELFAVEGAGLMHGNARGEPWRRIDLAPVADGAAYDLQAVDVAGREQALMAVGGNALFVSQDGGATFFQPPLSRWPAPWFYVLLLSGPLYAFYLMRPGKPETRVVDADETKGLSDKALSLKDVDALNLRSYAEGLADLLRNAETKPPLVVGVTGPWGSGKSSVMQMLSELLTQREMPVVWFNAWHHQSEDHLLASLLSNIRRQGIPGFWTRPGLRLRWRLMMQKLTPRPPFGGFLWSWLLLLAGAALVSGALALWLMPPVSVPEAVEAARAGNMEVSERTDRTQTTTVENGVETVQTVEKTEKSERRVGGGAPRDAASEVGQAVASVQDFLCAKDSDDCRQLIESAASLLVSLKLGAVITLLLGLVPLSQLKQVALIGRAFDPAKLMTSVMPAKRNPQLDEQLSFRHGFGEELRGTIAALAPYRLVIFIDDLDRCRPENVAAVLEAVNFVVSSADCYVVLGMDRAYVLRAIRQEFEKFIEMEKAERQDLSLGTPEEDKGRPRDFAEHYLEKLVNLIVSVPKMTPDGRARLMESLASAPAPQGLALRLDWWAWGRRMAAAAAILAALLLPAVYVATLAPPVTAVPPGVADAGSQPGADAAAGQPSAEQTENLARVVTPPLEESQGVPASVARTSLAPLLLALSAIVALIGIAWVAVRAISVPANLLIRDSGAFKTTLRSVEQRLASFMTTPRRAKRFVNRLRLFGAMLRSGRDEISPEREADLDRATVQAGALHALSRELLLAQPVDSAAPEDPTARAVWEETRRQADNARKTYREALVALYQAVDGARRPLVDALYWRFWQLSDGATLGDQAIVRIATEAVPGGAAQGGILVAPDPDALEQTLNPRALAAQ